MNNQNNITATGIAVALAVIIAIALLFFGPEIFGLFTNATTTGSQAASTTMQDDTASSTDGTVSATPLSDIPQNVTDLMGKDITVGTGATAEAGDSVTVQYVGMLTDGTVFDASENHGTQGFTFTLGAGQVIKGWDEGVVGMKVGGKRELIIPASLAYGSQANGPIPANSTLVFEVELVSVQPAAAQ